MAKWSPWRALRERPEITFGREELPGGVKGWLSPDDTDGPVILLAAGLSRRERRAVLAHELVHLERGGGVGWRGHPSTWAAVVARDERAVDREVARRLVPADELAAFVAAEHPEPVEAWQIAEAFDVPLWVVESVVA